MRRDVKLAIWLSIVTVLMLVAWATANATVDVGVFAWLSDFSRSQSSDFSAGQHVGFLLGGFFVTPLVAGALFCSFVLVPVVMLARRLTTREKRGGASG